MKKIAAVFALVFFMVCHNAWTAPLSDVALPDGFLNAEYTVGSGPNLSLVIIDFADTGGGAYAFGYRWSTPTDFGTVVQDLAGGVSMGGASLNPDVVVDPLYGTYVNNFYYGSEAGNANDYWRLEVGTYGSGGISWNTSGAGLSSVTTDNFSAAPTFDSETYTGTAGVIGFYNSFDDDSIKPRTPLAVSTSDKGNFKLDGATDAGDISAMLSALTDLDSYQNGSNPENAFLTSDNLLALGDVNGDGKITNADLQALLDLLISGGESAASVPEPAAWVLMLWALAGWAICAKRSTGLGGASSSTRPAGKRQL
jgi:hypothetical protein